MERGLYLNREEMHQICSRCRDNPHITAYGLEEYWKQSRCPTCPLRRTGRRDRKEYFKKYYQEKTKKKRQEARKNDNN